MKEIKRRLAAIMFTDMVGYSAMMQRDEMVANRLRDRHREIFRKYTEKYDGQILQYYGDGTLSIYPSASAAVECALDMQRELKQDPAVPLRVGIHTGDISFSDEDIFGDGVNIASRIEGECVPGGILISGKVYDDIKNHSRLKAKSLGARHLKNIQHPVELYAISNPGITVPEEAALREPAASTYGISTPAAPVFMPDTFEAEAGTKKKSRAGVLALLLGMFGAHRFYLGQQKLGMIYLAITLAGMFTFDFLGRLVGVMAIIGAIEAFVFWSMSKEDFDAKYNPQLKTAKAAVSESPAKVVAEPKERHLQQFQQRKSQAIREFNRFDYRRAIESLRKAAELKNDDPEIHFLLSCCYSVFEETEKSILHLDTAVAFGWNDLPRIREQYELAHLREQAVYKTFEKNEYRLPNQLPQTAEETLDLNQSMRPDLLEQLNKLQKLRSEGVLNEGEYLRLKVALQSSNGSKK
jgi:class 3 adenylate cyclase/TM2 domain-containing membrane protein YozV